jgi:hypothetical protein
MGRREYFYTLYFGVSVLVVTNAISYLLAAMAPSLQIETDLPDKCYSVTLYVLN